MAGEDWTSDEEELEVEIGKAEQVHYETAEGVEFDSKFVEEVEADIEQTQNESVEDDELRRSYGGKKFLRHHL
ncbi:hypothetical protein L1987_74157 [Smallanthus sonchifolius]|uniref:Uncharacterized protein n=1 Tax=Smallanthus sonchifolius TaxID=185202 RepID=A0ACB9A2B1_9ASTR|nr:hypothetical protein L1987_74157 [Smallanthus sonchifolius]